MLRIILDTNVLMDAELDENSYPMRVLKLVLAGDLVALVSNRTERENRKIVRRLSNQPEHLALIQQFFGKGERVFVTSRLSGITDDRDDDKFVELAKDGGADYIITKDRHLLDVEKFENTEIMNPEQFWNVYKEVAPDRVHALGY